MKNLTLAIDEDILREARAVALKRETSVNALVREYLRRLAREEGARAEARREILSMIGTFEGSVGSRVGREELHERDR